MATTSSSSIFNEIPTPFRFYDDEKKRNENKLQCQQEAKYQLITPQHLLLPFMIVRDYQIEDIGTFKIITENGASEYNLDTSLITRKTLGGKDYFVYKGDAHGLMLDCGYYYCEVADEYGRTYYSERFYVMASGYCGNYEVNGEFKTDLGGWNIYGDIEWDSGAALFVAGVGLGKSLSRYIGVSLPIQVTFTVTAWSGSGTAQVQLGSGTPTAITGNGTYTVTGSTGYSGRIFFLSDNTREFKLDDVIVSALSNDSMKCSLMLEWKSDCDFGNIYYGSGFFNRLYLPTDAPLGEPTYKITREGTTNGDGDFVEQFRKRQKIYQVEIGLVPEFIVDALMDMQIHPIKKIYLNDCGGYGIISDVSVAATWEFGGCFANVKITFALDEIVETGCCGDIQQCRECCADAFAALPEDTCTDGKYYIDQENGTMFYCDNGDLKQYPCDSLYVCRDVEDGSVDCPDGWILEDGVWKEIPAIVSVLPDSNGTSNYVVKARLMEGTYGQLEYSTDGGSSFSNLGVQMSAGDWSTIGQSFTFTIGSTYIFRINSVSADCDYGTSCEYSKTINCLVACTSAHQYKTAPYTVGESYMLLDGRIGTATTTSGDFTYIACDSQIVTDIDSGDDYVYSSSKSQWYKLPTIYQATESGGTVNIKAAIPLGSTGELYVNGSPTGTIATAAQWDSTGVNYSGDAGATYQFAVKATAGSCDYGTSDNYELTVGACTYYQPAGIDTSAHDPAAVWMGITMDSTFYDFNTFYGSYPALTDNATLQLAIEAVVGSSGVAVGYVAPNMFPNITTFNPASFVVNSITIQNPDTSTVDYPYSVNCV